MTINISNRLKKVASMVGKTNSIVDVGTDHGYVPIYLMEQNLINTAVASDINKGPVMKAEKNVALYHMQQKVSCRLGGGFSTVKPNEVTGAVIAGMGGNLIRDIIEEGMDVFKTLEFTVLQPVQNPEVLREYIIRSGYTILDEDIIFDEDKYYEIIKVKYDKNNYANNIEPIYFEISSLMLKKKDPVFKEYMEFKLNKYEKILKGLKEDTSFVKKRREELEFKVQKLKEFLNDFEK